MQQVPENNIELHSEPVREIMSQIPGWILRWGLSVLFGIVMLLLLGAYLVKYPETINAPVVITTINAPAALICKASGKIDRFYGKEGQYIEKNYLIAVIENTANYEHYCILKKETEKLSGKQNWRNLVLERENTAQLSLGDMQTFYEQFRKTWNDFRNYLLQGYIQQKINLIEQQIKIQKDYLDILLQQQSIAENDMLLAARKFKRDSLIFIDGGFSITEFEREKQKLNQNVASLKSTEASVKSAELTILNLSQTVLELRLQQENEIMQYELNLDELKQNLNTRIMVYEEQYLVRSPIQGTVTLSTFWSENQVVNIGDRMATILPKRESEIIGKAVIPTEGFGKVEAGQRVQIKLSGYPYMEYGILQGVISDISKIPDKEGYVAEIELPNGMKTSYHKQLNFTQEMIGTADIVTRDTRFIEKLINPVKSLIRNN
ncbi:MAG: HlyD family efflux transporter periplasmic adaptor subunit [Bacteroidales bacterium]|nr:HlyD family efflux transporter periplasmic adaptor subunit [Bacteroidales bacterium]